MTEARKGTVKDSGKKTPMPARYEIRIAGQLDETESATFAGYDITVCDNVTIVSGEFDQAGLHGVLERIRFLGLDLIEARRLRAPPGRRTDRRPQDGFT
jgi:hypothetical protein